MTISYKLEPNFSFLKKRLPLLAKVLIDCFLFFYIFNGQINSEHRFFYYSIGAFWLIVSYIIYRYNYSVKISETFRNFISTLLLVTFLNILIFSFINLFNYPHLFKFFNLFFSSSLVIQLGLNIIFLFLYGRKKLWIKITDDNEDNYFVSFKEQLSKNIIIKGISIDSLEKLDFKKFEGIIIDQNLSLKNDQIRLIKKLGQKGLTIINLVKFFELNFERIPSELVNKTYFKNRKNLNLQFKIKEISDFFFSLLLIIITAPIVTLSIILIYLEDKGPVFYSQVRTGKSRKKYRIHKLRTMKIDAEKNGAQWSTFKDQRITRIGKILRKTRIDELPQLFSVLNGDMSLIGPRPERPELEKKIIKNLSNYNLRYRIKPGLSGWAQVNYPYGASIEDTKSKLSYDLYYIRNFSTILDIVIFFKTMQIVFTGKGAIPIKIN